MPNVDYHIDVERHPCSVPFQLLGEQVEARFARRTWRRLSRRPTRPRDRTIGEGPRRCGGSAAIHWPDIDADISVPRLFGLPC